MDRLKVDLDIGVGNRKTEEGTDDPALGFRHMPFGVIVGRIRAVQNAVATDLEPGLPRPCQRAPNPGGMPARCGVPQDRKVRSIPRLPRPECQIFG